MTNKDLISKRTRNEFREFLVGWVLREIEAEFEAADVRCDRQHEPQVSGQRRSFVEQHYRTLDFTNPVDARKLLTAFEGILERAQREIGDTCERAAAEKTIEGLKACLRKDGFRFQEGKITAISSEARAILEDGPLAGAISEVTRRAIFDEIRVSGVSWWGALSETEFLSRLYDFSALPSTAGRFDSIERDIWQHRENNLDWDDDWVFADSRIDLLHAPASDLLRFLCAMVHPVVRRDSAEAVRLVNAFNGHLGADGWELTNGPLISGRQTFVPRSLASAHVAMPDELHGMDVLSGEYVRELSGKCDARLKANDFEGAITIGRTLLEAVLGELECRLSGARGKHKGDLPKQFKKVTKLLRMDLERSDLDERFKDVIRGLVMVANGLAPLRNKMSDGHARERKPASHHARVVVNAAKTVAGFLVESYAYQREMDVLRDAAQSSSEATA